MKPLVDYLVAVQLWFEYGFARVSIVLAAVNTGMLIVTVITVKGLYVPLWVVPSVVAVVCVACVVAGYYYETRGIWGKMISRQNRNMNPEFVRLCDDVEKIKRKLEIP